MRVRDSQPLVTDGPFVEAKEFMAGFDLLECTDLDECIAVAATAPLARFMAIEIRPFASEPRLDEKAAAFGRFQDGGEGDDPGEDPDGEQVLDEPDSGPRTRPGDRERPLEQRPVGLDDGQQQDDEAPERGRVRGPGMLHFSSFRCPITSVSCAFRSPGTWSCAYATRSGAGWPVNASRFSHHTRRPATARANAVSTSPTTIRKATSNLVSLA